jgi:Ca2+-binding EF-hand superfamily protein
VKGTKAGNNVLSANVVQALVKFKEYDAMQKLLCEVLSFTLLPEQIQDLRGEFEKLDKDGSGEISLAALKKVLMANAGAGSLGALTEEEVEGIFDAMRVRKTETTIHWHEFIAAGLSQCKVDDRNLRLAFDRLDSDHKGYISFGDICDLVGLNDASDESKRLKQQYLEGIRACCSNQTQICYDEFLLLMKGQKKQDKPDTSLSYLTQDLNMMDQLATSIHSSTNNLLTVPEEEEALEGIAEYDEGPAFEEDDMFGVALDGSNHSKSSYRSGTTVTSILSASKLLLDSHKRHDTVQDQTDNNSHQSAPTPLTVNRNLYRAHRTMRLAVLDASKRFEEMQVKRVFQEEVKKSMTSSFGAGLVMKHGETKKLSTEEVHEILRKRQEERNNLVQRAKRKSGRRQKNNRKKTVSDVSGMVGGTDEPEQMENGPMGSPVVRTSQRNRMLSNPEAAGFFAEQ